LLLFFYFKKYLSDFCQTSYLNIYRTDLHEICRIGKTLAADKVIFSLPQGTLQWQPILWAKSISNTHLVLRMTFARAAPPAHMQQEGKLLRRTLANKLHDSMDADEPN